MFPTFKKMHTKKAFTLVELMVTVAIFLVITTVVLYQNSKFNSGIILSNAAYEVALGIRQAQVYGVSSRRVTVGGVSGSAAFLLPYGVFFDIAPSVKKTFTFFADANSNNYYDSGEEISVTRFPLDIVIGNICTELALNLGVWNCDNVAPNDKATITFLRPNPEPNVLKNNTNGTGTGISRIKIILYAENDVESGPRCVIINRVGQVSVKSQSGC